jgi:hypothetical protein
MERLDKVLFFRFNMYECIKMSILLFTKVFCIRENDPTRLGQIEVSLVG